jgi:NAD dependent epimerase/dehydratase family enzyme
MHVFITGGLGFVGRRLSRALLDAGHEVTASGRSKTVRTIDHPQFQYVAADTTQEGPWQETAKKADAAANLAGVSIFSYWTESHKQRMVDSRILTTRNLVNALLDGNAKVLCSTSASSAMHCSLASARCPTACRSSVSSSAIPTCGRPLPKSFPAPKVDDADAALPVETSAGR